jgi:hypothetical protein
MPFRHYAIITLFAIISMLFHAMPLFAIDIISLTRRKRSRGSITARLLMIHYFIIDIDIIAYISLLFSLLRH